MSTDELLKALLKVGTLKLWMPEMDPDETVHRHVYMRPDVHSWVMSDPSDAKGLRYFATVRQFLKDFVIGEYFDSSHKLKNLDVDDLGKMDQGFYAFRLQRADPKARIFGGFAAPNIIVCTHREMRDGINFAKEKVRIGDIWTKQLKVRIMVGGQYQTANLPRCVGTTRTDLTCNNRSLKG